MEFIKKEKDQLSNKEATFLASSPFKGDESDTFIFAKADGYIIGVAPVIKNGKVYLVRRYGSYKKDLSLAVEKVLTTDKEEKRLEKEEGKLEDQENKEVEETKPLEVEEEKEAIKEAIEITESENTEEFISLKGFKLDENGLVREIPDITLHNGLNLLNDEDKHYSDILCLNYVKEEGQEFLYKGEDINPHNEEGKLYLLNLDVISLGKFTLLYSFDKKEEEGSKEKKSFKQRIKDSFKTIKDYSKEMKEINSSFYVLRKLPYKTEEDREERVKALIEVISKEKPLYVLIDGSFNVEPSWLNAFKELDIPVIYLKHPKAKKAKKEEIIPLEEKEKGLPPILSLYQHQVVFALMLFFSSFLAVFASLLSAYLFSDNQIAVAISLVICVSILWPINSLLSSSLISLVRDHELKKKKHQYQNMAIMAVIDVLGALASLGLIFFLGPDVSSMLSKSLPNSIYLVFSLSLLVILLSLACSPLLIKITQSKKKDIDLDTDKAA